MTEDQKTTLINQADELAIRIYEDIRLARTRDEHVRVTARANEARELANQIRLLMK